MNSAIPRIPFENNHAFRLFAFVVVAVILSIIIFAFITLVGVDILQMHPLYGNVRRLHDVGAAIAVIGLLGICGAIITAIKLLPKYANRYMQGK
jgi:hypothetical protein